jgi:hypothetical protein
MRALKLGAAETTVSLPKRPHPTDFVGHLLPPEAGEGARDFLTR